MTRIAFLIGEPETVTEANYFYFSNHLLARGDEVWLSLIDTLALNQATVIASSTRLVRPLVAGERLDSLQFSPVTLDEMDVVWILALGLRTTFLDKIQLLYSLSRNIQLINSVNAILFLKSKYLLSSAGDVFPYPETYASSNWEDLHAIIAASDGIWVLKPPAGSFGRDVFVVNRDEPNIRALLQNMTAQDRGQYCLLQRYVSEIAQGEKRVLLAGGKPVGQYLRQANGDPRTNAAQGAHLSCCDLNVEESRLCERVGEYLMEMGALYAGIDLVYPYLIEVNVINPGGLATIRSLSGEDLTAPILDSILR